MRMNHPEREYPRRQSPGRASGLFPVTRGDQGRDSKIEIVRAAALVLEPWVTTAVESRRFQPADRPPYLHPWRPFLSLAKVISIVGTYSSPRLSLSLFFTRTLRNSIREFLRWMELDRARMLDDLFSIHVDLIFMPEATTRERIRELQGAPVDLSSTFLITTFY